MPATMSLRTLLEGWCAELPDVRVGGLSLDSRTVQPGDAFVAIAGAQAHGLQFAAEAARRGAVAILHDGQAPEPASQVPLVRVEGLGERLAVLAARFYRAPAEQMTVVGVTGTNGKTSTAHFIAQAWQRQTGSAGMIGTLGYGPLGALHSAHLTTPDAVSLQRLLAECCAAGVTHLAMEASSHALGQGRCDGVAFAAAVFTNLSRDHLDYHGSMEAYAAAKRRLFTDCRPRFAVINQDDAFGRSLIRALRGHCEVLGYGVEQRAELRAAVVAQDASGMQLQVVGPWGRGPVRSTLLGRFNVANLLAAAGTLAVLGMPWQRVLHELELMHPVPGRMHCLGGDRGQPVVVIDFAHTPDALEQAEAALRAHLHGRLTCLFGCGGNRDRGKRPQMARIAEALADRVILTNDNPRDEAPGTIFAEMLAGMVRPQQATVIPDRGAAIREAITGCRPGDIVLVAGKGHEAWQECRGQRVPFSDEAAVRAALGEAA